LLLFKSDLWLWLAELDEFRAALVKVNQEESAIRALIKRKKRYFSDFFKPAFAATFRPDFAR